MRAIGHDFFPLENSTEHDIAKLCGILWGWKPCNEWIGGQSCVSSGCMCYRATKLEAFFKYYKEITASYIPEDVGNSDIALRSHDDLIDIIALIKSGGGRSRSELTVEYFGTRVCQTNGTHLSQMEKDRAFNLAARVLLMVQSAAQNQSDGLLEAGVQPMTWENDKSISEFVNSIFRRRAHPSLDDEHDVPSSAKITIGCLSAEKIKDLARLKMIPTHDLRDHLLLNANNGTVSVFHYTSMLKECLGLSSNSNYLTQDFVIETLISLKEVLFPDEAASQSILRSLVSRNEFDPDIIRIIDAPMYLAALQQPRRYQYWGTRLMDLYEELENPTPRGTIEKWLERRSGPRYVMRATLIGVLIAVVLGIFGLSVSIFQAWVGWQQWQHPAPQRKR